MCNGDNPYDDSLQTKWKCGACSFLNAEVYSHCKMCGLPMTVRLTVIAAFTSRKRNLCIFARLMYQLLMEARLIRQCPPTGHQLHPPLFQM